MQRAFDIARLGIGKVSPNPAVGAVLVHEDRIIGEGYHQVYGQAHAEVNALASVREEDRPLIPYSTLYISLEPCSIHGNTPPCTDLILREKIPKVIISQVDRTEGVDGTGVALLRKAGVEVIEDVLADRGKALSRPRNTFVSQQRPYIVLKWAQTQNGFFAPKDRSSFWITNSFSNRLVHKWRAETEAILVGTTTAEKDNPSLTTRLYPGDNPLRIVIDRQGRLPEHLNLFTDGNPTWVFHQSSASVPTGKAVQSFPLDFQGNWAKALLDKLYEHKIAHLTIEGGVQLLEHFMAMDLWDEARVLTGALSLDDGLPAPRIVNAVQQKHHLQEDQVSVYLN